MSCCLGWRMSERRVTAQSQGGGSRRTPRALRALVPMLVVLVLVTAGPCSCAPPHYGTDGSAVTSGERDFLASLESADKPDNNTEEAGFYVTLVRFGLSLALVLALAYLTILGLKRFTGLKAPFTSGHGSMRVVENLSLGAGRTLHLVEIGSRRMVVASTATSVSLVTEIGPDDLPPTASEPPPTFRDQLAMFVGAGTGSQESARNVARTLRDATSSVQDTIARLGSLRGRLRDA